LDRLGNLKIFDPACGSGNFLIIAYKELRRLEIRIIRHLRELKRIATGLNNESKYRALIPKSQMEQAAAYHVELFSRIELGQFYGIELDDFAHEIAQLSLWLAEHQMNMEFKQEFGQTNPTLPLKEAGHIVHGNACRIDWERVCPKKEGDEIYILGNPPYLGSSLQNDIQKKDMELVFNENGIRQYKSLDYIACWFIKGANFIKGMESKLGLVSTDSICQGQQINMLWPHILKKDIEIGYAHSSFKWGNSAKSNAGVSVIIVGLRNKSSTENKILFDGTNRIEVQNINFYLSPTKNVIVSKRQDPLSKFPRMSYGNKAVYGDPLILSDEEANNILISYPKANNNIKKLIGAKEFLDGNSRWCIWVEDFEYNKARNIPPLNERFENVKNLRLQSKDEGARKLANTPHQFRDTKTTQTESIVVPLTTSERRHYIPIRLTKRDEILSN